MSLLPLSLADHRFPVDPVRGGQGRSRLPAPVAGEDIQRELDAWRSLVDLPRGARGKIDGGNIMWWRICGVLAVLWLVGYIGGFGGWLIHLLLVAAVIGFVVSFLAPRRTV